MMLVVHILIHIFWLRKWNQKGLSYLKPHSTSCLWPQPLDEPHGRVSKPSCTKPGCRARSRTRATGEQGLLLTLLWLLQRSDWCHDCAVSSPLKQVSSAQAQMQRISKYTLFIQTIYFPDTFLACKSKLPNMTKHLSHSTPPNFAEKKCKIKT